MLKIVVLRAPLLVIVPVAPEIGDPSKLIVYVLFAVKPVPLTVTVVPTGPVVGEVVIDPAAKTGAVNNTDIHTDKITVNDNDK